MKSGFFDYLKALLNIAFPIIIGNLGFMLIGIGDVLVAGRHSTDTLAAVSIATAITNCIQIFGIGILVSVSPLISNYRGEKIAAKKYFYPTLRFSFFIALIIMFVVLASIPLIDFLNFESHLVPMIKEYIFITAFATFGGYLHAAVKEFLQAFEIVMIPNLLTGLAVILNLGLNIILVFGFGPIPSLGAVGLAVASLVVRYFMGIVLLIYCMSIMKFQNYTDYNYYKSLVKIGLPISFAIMVEFVTFNSVSIILGRISGIYAAAQTLLCTFANMTFMIPLALSNAIAVKVGFANGAKNIADLKRYSFVGITMSVMFMMVCAIVYFSVPEFLIKLFTNDVELIKITVPVLYILAMFEVFDGLQVSLSGIFKGLKKTSVVLLSNMIGYWFVAIPLGLILAFRFNFMLSGFWIGILVASIVLCLIMGIMLRTNLKKIEKEVLI